MASACDNLPFRLNTKADEEFLGCLAKVADEVEAVKAMVVDVGLRHEQMLERMDKILASAAVLCLYLSACQRY